MKCGAVWRKLSHFLLNTRKHISKVSKSEWMTQISQSKPPQNDLQQLLKEDLHRKKTLNFRQKGILNVLNCFKIHRERNILLKQSTLTFQLFQFWFYWIHRYSYLIKIKTIFQCTLIPFHVCINIIFSLKLTYSQFNFTSRRLNSRAVEQLGQCHPTGPQQHWPHLLNLEEFSLKQPRLLLCYSQYKSAVIQMVFLAYH